MVNFYFYFLALADNAQDQEDDSESLGSTPELEPYRACIFLVECI
jgi:hypothetical protein